MPACAVEGQQLKPLQLRPGAPAAFIVFASRQPNSSADLRTVLGINIRDFII